MLNNYVMYWVKDKNILLNFMLYFTIKFMIMSSKDDDPQDNTFHWWYQKNTNEKWFPYSMLDSKKLENANMKNYRGLVRTNGGRYDTSPGNRERYSVYWNDTEPLVTAVCRVSWYKHAKFSSDYQPYGERLEKAIESEYLRLKVSNKWNFTMKVENNFEVSFISANRIVMKKCSYESTLSAPTNASITTRSSNSSNTKLIIETDEKSVSSEKTYIPSQPMGPNIRPMSIDVFIPPPPFLPPLAPCQQLINSPIDTSIPPPPLMLHNIYNLNIPPPNIPNLNDVYIPIDTSIPPPSYIPPQLHMKQDIFMPGNIVPPPLTFSQPPPCIPNRHLPTCPPPPLYNANTPPPITYNPFTLDQSHVMPRPPTTFTHDNPDNKIPNCKDTKRNGSCLKPGIAISPFVSAAPVGQMNTTNSTHPINALLCSSKNKNNVGELKNASSISSSALKPSSSHMFKDNTAKLLQQFQNDVNLSSGNKTTQPEPLNSQKNSKVNLGKEFILRRNIESEKIFPLPPDEIEHIDYLIFVVPGINCNKNMDWGIESMDKFRDLNVKSLNNCEYNKEGKIRRIEYLPVHWDNGLFDGYSSIEAELTRVMLPNNPILREHSVDSILDAMLYCKSISKLVLNKTVNEINRMYKLFRRRNPLFTGGISIIGHGLGSVIIFDILSVQRVESYENDPSISEFLIENDMKKFTSLFANKSTIDLMTYEMKDYRKMKLNKFQSYKCLLNFHGDHNNYVKFLQFNPENLFMFGSPLPVFLLVRGRSRLGPNFKLPTCPGFYNIFHSCDPASYRMEPIVCERSPARSFPIDINYSRISERIINSLGVGIKEIFCSDFDSTLQAFYNKHIPDGTGDSGISSPKCGSLNHNGRRIDFILKPSLMNLVNEYMSSIKSHNDYWYSKDVVQFIINELEYFKKD